MKKDVIYIDTEDDITAIIGKVKNARASIVALVPTKRTGVLQSTVSLKLLQRAAEESGRRIVLITNDPALTGLAAGMALPVAKNLQSKPEIAPIPVLAVDEDDVINGEDLPVGELASTAPSAGVTDASQTNPSDATNSQTETKESSRKNKNVSVPNFNAFRKKLFIFVGIGVVVIAFFVWAIVFAPRAVIAITARTNTVNIGKVLQVQPNTSLNISQGVIPALTKQTKKTVSTDFTPTGKKEVGDRATSTVKFTTNSISALGTIAAGTTLSSASGIRFTTDSVVTLTVANAMTGVTTGVTAVNRGASSNGATGQMTGVPSGVTATLVAATSGGTDKTITVVTADDVAKAKTQLQVPDANAVKAEITKQFSDDQKVIPEGFIVTTADPISTPAVDAEATTAKLTQETTYVLVGVARADIRSLYDAELATQLKGDASQKVYDNGESTTQFSQFTKTDSGFSVRVTAVAQVGPAINTDELEKKIGGMRVGEVQQTIESIQGVKDVNVTLSPFWVTRVPKNTDQVSITFTLAHE